MLVLHSTAAIGRSGRTPRLLIPRDEARLDPAPDPSVLPGPSSTVRLTVEAFRISEHAVTL